MSETQGRVRRGTLRRRLDLTLVLAIVLPVVAAVALLLTRPDAWTQAAQQPTEGPLRSQTLICPDAMRGADRVGLATLGTDGTVTTGDGATLDVAAGRVTDARAGKGGVVLSATGASAPGLLAGRGSTGPVAATDCAPPIADAWFTGLGAGAAHNSTIELTNPNKGSATVDLSVLTRKGLLEEQPQGAAYAQKLRGISVPGRQTRTFDLAKVMPWTGILAVHATVVRGQAAIDVRDRSGQLVSSGSEEWLPPQATPATQTLLLGVPHAGEAHTLTLANGGDDQVSASIKLVTPDSVLAPARAPSVTLPPQTVRTVDLSQILDASVARDAYGLEVDATGPVTASLRTVNGGDLAITGPGASVSAPTALVLPAGTGVDTKKVAIAGATHVGAITLISRTAGGRQLASKRVAVQPQQGAYVDVPAKAAIVELRPERTAVTASVLLSGRGVAVVPFRELVTATEMPAVAPGLR
ncbi:DUF5719 family protein [Nocardioides sp. DS6]|uniref:DUF5719 family protein n=1 Tax=Nocardioides eburneus TaxID=3231482 RepID=A0ABV3T300_9ACTN